MEVLGQTPEEILKKTLDFALAIAQAMGQGWAGVVSGLIGIFGLGLFYLVWKRVKDKAAQDETERKRKEAQANNPGENADAERDASQAADDIEEIIDEHERKGGQ